MKIATIKNPRTADIYEVHRSTDQRLKWWSMVHPGEEVSGLVGYADLASLMRLKGWGTHAAATMAADLMTLRYELLDRRIYFNGEPLMMLTRPDFTRADGATGCYAIDPVQFDEMAREIVRALNEREFGDNG